MTERSRPGEQDELVRLARNFVGAAFRRLAALHVIPTPHYHPWVRVGTEYAGGDVMGPELKELETKLQAMYPDRFADPLTREYPEFPGSYVFSLLEAAIRRCSGDGTYEADAPPVRESIDEFIQVLDAQEYTMSCCRTMSHVTTEGEAPVSIGDITIFPENTTQGLIDGTVQAIPAAGSSFGLEPPFFYDPPHSLLVTRKTTNDPNPYMVASELARRLDRFLLIGRLLYAGTYESAWQVTGLSTLVSRLDPLYQRFEKSGLPNVLMRRTIEFAPEHAPAIASLSSLVDRAVVKRGGMAATPFDVALLNYARSHEQGNDYARVVDLVTALEAILIGGEKETEGVGLRLRSRAAALLWTENDSGRAIFDDVKNLYNLRSQLVHGAHIKEKDLLKWLKSVSTVPDGAGFGVTFSFAVDRLRDLVRRSFLARLCLAYGDKPLWRFDTSPAVDAALSDETERAHWRTTWRNRLESLGVAGAADPATPAVDPLVPNPDSGPT